MPVFETPSRVWRRIQAADDLALPSLPSLPAIDNDDLEDESDSQPLQSTPSLVASTKKATTVRFAETHESFEFSDILPITHQSILTEDDGDKPPVDYSIDLNTHISPPVVDLNKNVALRRARTPSLTRSASLPSTSSDETPSSDAHISLPNASRRSSTSLRQQSIVEEVSRDNAEQRTKQSPSISRTSSIPDIQQTPRQAKQQQQDASTNNALNATPHAKKRSFLLDVIQSTAKPRPRLSMHTPMQTRPSFTMPASAAALITTPKPAVNDSFISTASSHDLTIHQPNVNASFDHLTGAKGVGRFNATKLNTYLHGLNRRLVEENEALTRQLKLQQPSTIMESDESMKALEIAALEDKVNNLEAALKKEKDEKESEKLKFKERVKEVEEGVNEIVERLEQDLEIVGQAKEQALIKARRAQELKEDAEERARRAEVALAKFSKESTSLRRSAIGSPTGSGTASSEHEELKEAIERVVELEAELRVSNNRCQNLEEELRGAEEELEEFKADKQVGEKEMTALKNQVEELNAEADGLDARVKELEEELAEAKQQAEQLSVDLAQVQEEAEVVKDEAEGAKADVEVLQERVDILESRCTRFENESRQMEEALEAGETKAIQDHEEIESLRHEIQRLRLLVPSSLAASSVRASTNTAVSANASPPSIAGGTPAIEEVESLEKELDEAYREISRLQHRLRDSPGREALTQAKDTRIEILEKENVDLEERIRTLRVLVSKGPMVGNGSLALLGTPLGRGRSFGGATSSPAGHNMPSILGPKTPGGPLRELSWLQTADNPDEMQYIRQISLLERELAHANESVDDKIDKLDEYGRGVIGLTDKLADAESRIAFLDGEVKRLERREERRARRLRKGISCGGCGGIVRITGAFSMDDQSSADASTQYAGDVTTNESMKKVLEQLDKMKQDWAHEKMRLEGEREYLQGAADRLNREMDRAKKEQDMKEGGVLSELDQARRVVGELEGQLQMERARLKAITSERNRMINEKVDIAANLERTQVDMDAVKQQLRKCKQENYALEADLRSNAIAETKSRHLQNKVTENQTLIDQLRHERDQLAESHSALQQRYTLASERVERLRTDLRTTQNHHDDRRHQLDLQIAEIEDLLREIAWRDEELAQERRKGEAGSELAATVNALEKEVDRVRADAEMFSHELKALRDSRDDLELVRREEASRAERVQMQLKAQVRVLDEQAEEHRSRIRRLVEELESHVCVAGGDTTINKLKLQHSNECKGLMVQIHYLKVKFTRENTFRMELAYQKQYLLLLLSRYVPNPMSVLAPTTQTSSRTAESGHPRRKWSIRSVAQTVIFVSRARKAATLWSEQNKTRDQLMLALEDVHRRRAIAGGR